MTTVHYFAAAMPNMTECGAAGPSSIMQENVTCPECQGWLMGQAKDRDKRDRVKAYRSLLTACKLAENRLTCSSTAKDWPALEACRAAIELADNLE